MSGSDAGQTKMTVRYRLQCQAERGPIRENTVYVGLDVATGDQQAPVLFDGAPRRVGEVRRAMDGVTLSGGARFASGSLVDSVDLHAVMVSHDLQRYQPVLVDGEQIFRRAPAPEPSEPVSTTLRYRLLCQRELGATRGNTVRVGLDVTYEDALAPLVFEGLPRRVLEIREAMDSVCMVGGGSFESRYPATAADLDQVMRSRELERHAPVLEAGVEVFGCGKPFDRRFGVESLAERLAEVIEHVERPWERWEICDGSQRETVAWIHRHWCAWREVMSADELVRALEPHLAAAFAAWGPGAAARRIVPWPGDADRVAEIAQRVADVFEERREPRALFHELKRGLPRGAAPRPSPPIRLPVPATMTVRYRLRYRPHLGPTPNNTVYVGLDVAAEDQPGRVGFVGTSLCVRAVRDVMAYADEEHGVDRDLDAPMHALALAAYLQDATLQRWWDPVLVDGADVFGRVGDAAAGLAWFAERLAIVLARTPQRNQAGALAHLHAIWTRWRRDRSPDELTAGLSAQLPAALAGFADLPPDSTRLVEWPRDRHRVDAIARAAADALERASDGDGLGHALRSGLARVRLTVPATPRA